MHDGARVSDGGALVAGNGTPDRVQRAGRARAHLKKITIKGKTTVNTAAALVPNASEQVVWNTGGTTLLTEVRTIAGTGLITEAGAVIATSGPFNTSVEADAATGTRTRSGTAGSLSLRFTRYTLAAA